MIYFLRRRYSVAAFFITVNLVLLFNINRELNDMVILTRALSTIAGSAIALIAGFALLPTWDKEWLPKHLAQSVYANYIYFRAVFFPADEDLPWTRYKGKAESANSNAFDSFSRYMEEPSFRKRPFAIFYYIITHNIRITRELNNIELEQGNATVDVDEATMQRQKKLVLDCLVTFNENIPCIRKLDAETVFDMSDPTQMNPEFQPLSPHQEIYLEKMLVELKAMHKDLVVLAEKLPRIMQL
jgi:hypothetical protein